MECLKRQTTKDGKKKPNVPALTVVDLVHTPGVPFVPAVHVYFTAQSVTPFVVRELTRDFASYIAQERATSAIRLI